MKRTLLALGLGAALVCASGFDALAREVRLKPQPTVQRPIITLGDLFDNTGPDAQNIIVADAPSPGEKTQLRAGYVATLVRDAGLTWAGDQALRNITVTRGGKLIPRTDLLKALSAEAARQAGNGRFDVDIDTRSSMLYVADGEPTTVRVENFDIDRRSGNFTAIALYPADSANPERTKISGRALQFVELPVLRDNLPAGRVISWNDIDYIEVRPDQIQRMVVTNPSEMVGMSLSRPLPGGQAVRVSDLRKADLVNRNGMVSIIYRVPGMVLAAPGRAIEAGSQGDVIQVMNLQNNKTVYARIVAPGEVSPIGPTAAAGSGTQVN